jgi:hypothetical protein
VAKVRESTAQICLQLGLEDTGLDCALIVSAQNKFMKGATTSEIPLGY